MFEQSTSGTCCRNCFNCFFYDRASEVFLTIFIIKQTANCLWLTFGKMSRESKFKVKQTSKHSWKLFSKFILGSFHSKRAFNPNKTLPPDTVVIGHLKSSSPSLKVRLYLFKCLSWARPTPAATATRYVEVTSLWIIFASHGTADWKKRRTIDSLCVHV